VREVDVPQLDVPLAEDTGHENEQASGVSRVCAAQSRRVDVHGSLSRLSADLVDEDLRVLLGDRERLARDEFQAVAGKVYPLCIGGARLSSGVRWPRSRRS
jgi:hypothetical protein